MSGRIEMQAAPDVVNLRAPIVALMAYGGAWALTSAERKEHAGEQLGVYERAFRIEVAREIQRKIADLAPAGAERRHDGTEDPGMAAWVEGLRGAHSVVQEYIEADV